MKRVGITYEITRRCYKEYDVSDQDYVEIYKGNLPEEIAEDLENSIDELEGDRDDDWSAEDIDTGKTIQDWRN